MGELELFRTPLEVCVAFAGSSLQPPTPSNPSSNLKAAQGEEAGLNHSAKGQPQPPAQYLTSPPARVGGGTWSSRRPVEEWRGRIGGVYLAGNFKNAVQGA